MTLEHCPCFLVFLWCGFDGTAEGCVSVAERHNVKGFSPDLTSYTDRHPCGTPLDPLKEWGEPPVSRGGDYKTERGGRRGKTQTESGPSCGYLHRVTSSSRGLWAGWKYVRRNLWILVAYTSTPLYEWLIERRGKREKKRLTEG